MPTRIPPEGRVTDPEDGQPIALLVIIGPSYPQGVISDR